jgi:hypothetical protein
VRKHLRAEEQSDDFCRRVDTEQTIDEALIRFLKAKVRRAEAVLSC